MLTKEKIAATNNARLSDVKPILAEACRKIIALAESEGFALIVTCGYRSPEEQEKLYRVGRRGVKGERIVTNARGGQSNHNHREAVDFAFVVGGQISWEESLYQNLGRWAKMSGLNWGGNWTRFKDFPHVEL